MNRFLRRNFLATGLVCAYLITPRADAQNIITTYAGGLQPATGVFAATQSIQSPVAVAADRAGGFYVASDRLHRVYHVDAAGTLELIAGNGATGSRGDGGPAIEAQLENPWALAVDGFGNLFIADIRSYRVRKVTPAGIISTVAGNGSAGAAGDGGPAISAQLYANGIAADAAGNIFVADGVNHVVRKVDTNGTITRIAGTGVAGFQGDGGAATSAQLRSPIAIAVDSAGNIFVADSGNNRIRKINPSGLITTVAGNGTTTRNAESGVPATSVGLSFPSAVSTDDRGNVFIFSEFLVSKVNSSGTITRLTSAISGLPSGDGGPATQAVVGFLSDISADAAGNMFLADSGHSLVRRIDFNGIIDTVVGNGNPYFRGDGGPATAALLNYPFGMAFDGADNLFVADGWNDRIRMIDRNGIISTVAGNGSFSPIGDGGPAVLAGLDMPVGVAIDPAGNLLITDPCNNSVRRVENGVISTIASGLQFMCYQAAFPLNGIAVSANGTVFVFDIEFNQINAFSPAGPVQNFAGVGSAEGFSGDGGPAVSAELDYPEGIAVDAEGNLFIADTGNHRIRKVDRNGIITTVAGDGTPGFTSEGTPLPNGDGGQATLARITYPGALAFDHAGNLFIAEGYKIRKVTPQGIITTVVGKGYGYDGDGGPAIDAKLGHIGGLAVDSENNLYIADSDNNRIRKVTFGPPKLTAVTPNVVYRGATLDVRLSGTGLAGPIAIDAGEAITVSNIRVVSDLSVVVTLAIGNAALGQRTVAITTGHGTSNAIPLTVVPESPDLSITSSIIEDFGVGFNGRYGFVIRNVGTRTTQGPITVTDKLPPGFTYVSGSGEGWSCAPAAGMVSCTNSGSLDVGASTELALTVAVPNNVSGCPTNEVTVEGTGDIISLNNASQTAACVTPAPAPVVQISSSNLSTGQQAMAQVTLSHAFPYDLTGELTVGFQAFAVPADDPALQFATGGRQISFVVPANTLQARFGDLQLTQVDFQAGTVAGTLTFTGILKVGTVEERHATTRVVPAIAPTIHKVETTGGDVILITLSSTVRNVMRLRVTFNTTSPVQLSCGSVAGCSVSGTTVTFDVKLLFDQWYRDDKVYGGLARLRVPFSIQGSVKGTVTLALQNIVGISAPAQLSLP